MTDLWKEFVDNCYTELIASGLNIDTISNDKIPLAYLNWLKRAVPAIPRQIFRSSHFSCPPEFADGLVEIERKIATGENLQPHLSTRLRNPEYNDLMLNDWGVYHLHLGLQLQSNGFVERTGQLLYARFDELNAYLLGIILGHGQWTCKDTIRELHENWPSTIERYRINKVAANDTGHTDNEHAAIRKHNGNALIHIEPGVAYIGPGGGLVASGASINTICLHDYLYSSVKKFENNFLGEQTKTLSNKPKVRLVVRRNNGNLELFANDLNNNTYVTIARTMIN